MEITSRVHPALERKVLLAERLLRLVNEVGSVLDDFPYLDSLMSVERVMHSQRTIVEETVDVYLVEAKLFYADPMLVRIRVKKLTETRVAFVEYSSTYLVGDEKITLPSVAVDLGLTKYVFPPTTTAEALFFVLSPRTLGVIAERFPPDVGGLARIAHEIATASEVRPNLEVLAEKAVEVARASSVNEGFGAFYLEVPGMVLVGVGSEVVYEPPDYEMPLSVTYVDVKLGNKVSRILSTKDVSGVYKLTAKLVPSGDLEIAITELEGLLEATKRAKVATVAVWSTLSSGIYG